MDHCPFAALAHPDADRFHNAAAVRCPVARLLVHMEATKAVGTMVAMVAARTGGYHQPAADFAGKTVAAGVSFIIPLFKGFSFIFPIQGDNSS